MKASDFINQLEQNPEYLEMRRQKELELQHKLKEIEIIEDSFIKDLNANGFIEIKDSDDLLKLKKVSTELTDLLLKWLPEISNKYNSQEMLVRALAIAESSFDGKLLMQLFDNEKSSESLKWAIANTIASTKVLGIGVWLEAKLNSIKQGKENEMFVYAAPKYIDYEKSEIILKKLFDIYPLQVADVFSKMGKGDNLEFLQLKSKNYKGEISKQIGKYINKLKKRIISSNR